MTPIACIVPTRSDHWRLRLVLEGFALQGGPVEVHVCDDGGEDAAGVVAAFAGRVDARYHYLGPPGASGRRAAVRNVGIRAARAARLLFVDGDCVPTPGLVAAHAAYGDDAVAILGVRRSVDMRHVAHVRPESVASIGSRHAWRHGCHIRCRPFMAAAGRRVPLDPWWAASCHVSYPGRLLASIGGFWEAFVGWGYEDTEVALRMARAGCQCVPRPDLVVYHLEHPANRKDKSLAPLMAMTERSDVVCRGPDLWPGADPVL